MVRFIPFSYAAVSAIIGTYSVTIGKALSGIVLAAFDPNLEGEILTIWPWLILLLFIGFTIFWVCLHCYSCPADPSTK